MRSPSADSQPLTAPLSVSSATLMPQIAACPQASPGGGDLPPFPNLLPAQGCRPSLIAPNPFPILLSTSSTAAPLPLIRPCSSSHRPKVAA
jgi:hypothetical protein